MSDTQDISDPKPARPPRASRPEMPDGYGIPASTQGMLPWSFVEERMAAAKNYWIGTVRPDGRPHSMPVWGVWLDGTLYFEGSPETRRGRNIAANPAVVVHLESGDQVVIIEGEAYETSRPERPLAVRLAEAYTAKYAPVGYQPGPDSWDQGGLYVLQPHTVFAWTSFPKDTTRWQFDRQ